MSGSDADLQAGSAGPASLAKRAKRVAVLSPVAWRTPPRHYGAWETVASNLAEGLVARGWNVTLFATKDSITRGRLHAVIDKGYEEDPAADPKVAEYLHIAEAFEHATEFDLIHSEGEPDELIGREVFGRCGGPAGDQLEVVTGVTLTTPVPMPCMPASPSSLSLAVPKNRAPFWCIQTCR